MKKLAKESMVEIDDGPALPVDGSLAARLTSKLGQRGQVVIPKPIRDKLALGLNTELEFEEQGGVITMRPKKDMAAFRDHMKKWRGAFAGQLQRDGYNDVDDYMRVMRGR